MCDTNTAWCHGGAKITRCQHCTLGRSSLLFSPIWFTFIIYETCLTNPQQRFQIMIGICQCRIVFLKTITTVPGNVNMSIEGNTSLNKPIFCKNKTKSKKRKIEYHAQKREIWAPASSPRATGGKIHPSRQTVETQKHIFIISPIMNCEAFNIWAPTSMKLHEKGNDKSQRAHATAETKLSNATCKKLC